MYRRVLFCIALILAALIAVDPVRACLHGPVTFTGRLGAESYVALLLHAQGREELILNVQIDVEGPEGEDGETLPTDDALAGLESIGWVIALPAQPDGYSADIKPEVFRDAERLMPKAPEDDESEGVMTFGADSGPKGLEVRLVKVGPYRVHEIKATGLDAVQHLNGWFKENGYPTKPESEMSFFVEAGYTFLCIRVDRAKLPAKPEPQAGEKADGAPSSSEESGMGLPPLRVSFAAEKPFIPLKFSSHQGVFSLQVLMLTADPVDWPGSHAVLENLGFGLLSNLQDEMGAVNHPVEVSDFQGELARLWKQVSEENRLPAQDKWYFNNLVVYEVNTDEHPIAEWTSDTWFELDRDPLGEAIREALDVIVRPWNDLDEPAESALAKIRGLGVEAVPSLLRAALMSEERRCAVAAFLASEAMEKSTDPAVRAGLASFVQPIKEVLEENVGPGGMVSVYLGGVLARLGEVEGLEVLVLSFHGDLTGDLWMVCGLPGSTPESKVRYANWTLKSLTGVDHGIDVCSIRDMSGLQVLDNAWAEWFPSDWDEIERRLRFDPATGRWSVVD